MEHTADAYVLRSMKQDMVPEAWNIKISIVYGSFVDPFFSGFGSGFGLDFESRFM
jgi:hypothetical protein